MVCSKCQRKLSRTELATPAVKRKNDLYYGSPTASAGNNKNKTTTPTPTPTPTNRNSTTTLGNTGISKNKLLSAQAKNPYAAYASSCEGCQTKKTEAGRRFCQRCAYSRNACAMCGKSLSSSSLSSSAATGTGTGTKKNDQSSVPVIQGQKFNAK